MGAKSLIEIKDIYKTYKSGEIRVPALIGLSLVIQKGEFLVIVGRNGSGKSTLLRQVGLLDVPDKGAIFLNGQEVVKLREKERNAIRLKKLGYIFQDYALVEDLTATENVMLPALMLERTIDARKKAQRLIEKVGLKERRNNLPSQLSGGEQQKVAIARALINNPEILIADEPTANLDTAAAKSVLEVFKDLNQKDGHTIVMVTHEKEEERYGSRIVTLQDGKILN